MKRHISLFSILAISFLFGASCSHTPQYTSKTLPSGRVVKIASIGKMFFTQGDASSALMLKYYSDISMDDTTKLQGEVEELWSLFRIDVEKSNMNAAIISANEMPSGFISKTRSFNFVFKKEPSGEWILTNNQMASSKKTLNKQRH